jgi:hypothetical protein
MAEILDLDILRPPKRIVKLDGKEIDVSFVPCGITFEIDEIRNELVKIVLALEKATDLTGNAAIEAAGNSPEAKRAFELGIRICAAFCSVDHPELDSEWFMKNSSPIQVGAFSEMIQQALIESYAGVEDYQKKMTAVKKK